MDSSVKAAVQAFIDREKLPPDYLQSVEQWFLPVAEEILGRVSRSSRTYVVGISGSQGSGKSTLAHLLVILLREMMGLKCINLSIDDFYATRASRLQLAEQVHPLLATRGVPGTHDVDLALGTIEDLSRQGEVKVPRFDKARDDRHEESRWPMVQGPVDVIVFEGWCLCVPPQPEADLREPVNQLEREEDPDGVWRRYVNERIQADYSRLYALMDFLIMLKAPDFSRVFDWRRRQEEKLAEKSRGEGNAGIMSQVQLKRFIQHYERLTRHGLETLPDRADVVFELTDEQTIATRE